jgi:hypothetical protein
MIVNKKVAIDHGLKKDEYEKICELLKRTPNITELGIFSAMWNEHCSYKSSRLHLKKLPIKGKQVIQGPGENAGVIDIGDNDVLEFHIAHNEGNYFCTKDQLKEIEDNEQVAIKYCDKDGKTEEQFNPNGSIKNIAGIFNRKKNVLGMMPHPERMIDPSLSGEDGSLFFNNLINNLK